MTVMWLSDSFLALQIRGIQKKRYNKEIFVLDTGSDSFPHDGGKNPG